MEDQLGGIINRVVQNIEVTSEAKALLPKDSTGIDFAQEFSVDTDSLSGDEMQGSLLYRWGDMIMGRDPVLIRFVPEAASAAESENFANGSQAAETTPAPAKSGFSLETLTNLDVPMPVRILLDVYKRQVQSPEQTPSPPQGTQVENEKILLIFSSLLLENVI